MEPNWRAEILKQIHVRNKREKDAFSSVVTSHDHLLEVNESLRTKNLSLSVQVEKLKQENFDLQIKAAEGGGGVKSEKLQVLEQKLFKAHEELTELHRKKGENAQQVINLNAELQNKTKEIQQKDTLIRELTGKLADFENQLKVAEQRLNETLNSNQSLLDEQQALQMAFSSLDEKFRRLYEENSDLIRRWVALKAQAADKVNEDNEVQQKAKQEKLQKDLAEASKDYVHILAPKSRNSASEMPVACGVLIPSNIQHSLEAHEGEVSAVQWAPSGRKFASGGADRKLKLWEVVGGNCDLRSTLSGCNAAIMSIQFDTEENLVVAACNDFASRVWTVNDQRLRNSLTGHSGKVLAAKFLGDHSRIVSGSHDRTLKVWDLRTNACTSTLFAGSSCNDVVTLDSGGSNIISGHLDKKIRFWDSRTGSSAQEIPLGGKITSLDLTSDKNVLLSCSRAEDIITIIDLRQTKVLSTLSADGFRPAFDWARAVFSPDGEYVLAGSNDCSLYIWRSSTGRLERVLKGHKHPIIACSWCPLGNRLLSSDKFHTVSVWADF